MNRNRRGYKINWKKLGFCLALPTALTILIEVYGANFGHSWTTAYAWIWGIGTWVGSFFLSTMCDIK